jgi:hypothetical protein
MNPQAKSICVASTSVIRNSVRRHDGKHDTSMFSSLAFYSGVIYVGLAGLADSTEQFANLCMIHQVRARAIPKILVDHPEPCLELAERHLVKALSLTRRTSELEEELAFLAAFDDELDLLHYRAAEWGISLVSVSSLIAVSTGLFESETTSPESVASIMAYICRYVLTRTQPDEYWVEQFANDPPMLRLAKIISRSLQGSEFKMAVGVMQKALVPAWDYLTPLRTYN